MGQQCGRGQFWLKSHLSCFVSLQVGQVCMGAQSEGEEPGSDLAVLWWILSGVFCLGLAVGSKATLVWLRIRHWWKGGEETNHQTSIQGLQPPGWRSVVIRALRFIRKRRKISLAFSNYRNKPLKHSPSPDSGWADQPSQALLSRKRAERLEPLREGPAFGNGAHRGRT